VTQETRPPRFELVLDPEQRSQLGLAAGESIRLLASTPRTLTLERKDPDSIALPFDRDLVLWADVHAFPMADLLQLVHSTQKSGFLYFHHGECVKTVYLHAGEVVFATSNQRVDRLGECLLRSGAINAAQRMEADKAYQPPSPFGRFLVEKGYLSPRELWDGVKLQVEEIVRSLFAFQTGTVLLWEGEVRPDNVVRLALATHRLVAEGLSQRDEMLRFLAQLEDPRVWLVPEDVPLERFGGTERAILDALEDDGAFSPMCRQVGIDPLSGARTVRLLHQVGALRIERARDEDMVLEDPEAKTLEEETLRACVRAHAKLIAELAAPVVALEGPDGLRERLGEVAAEAAERHPQLLGELELGPGGVLDPEALIARSLRFPGDRMREVRASLGELISYLEFELMNHPKIQDAEIFMEGVEGLREEL
jgi:hypothetical protein